MVDELIGEVRNLLYELAPKVENAVDNDDIVEALTNAKDALGHGSESRGGFSSMKHAAHELQAIREELAGGHADREELIRRVDAVGHWVAAKGKPTGLSAKLLTEANSLHDKLRGGSGKMGITRIQLNATQLGEMDVLTNRLGQTWEQAWQAVTGNEWRPDEQRDERGRWTSGGGSAGGDKDKPLKTSDVEEAAKALAQGRKVELDSPRRVSTLLDKLRSIVQDAKEKGKDAPKYDLCNVSVKGTNLFCVESKGIPRIRMPQLSGKPTPGSEADKLPKNAKGEVDLSSAFRDYLTKKLGVKIEDDHENAAYLKASQNQLDGAKVSGMAGAIEAGKYDPTKGGGLFVSKDNYIVDGHHRWAASVGVQYGKGKEMTLPVQRVDMDIIHLLAHANRFTTKMGIKQAAVNRLFDFLLNESFFAYCERDKLGHCIGEDDQDEGKHGIEAGYTVGIPSRQFPEVGKVGPLRTGDVNEAAKALAMGRKVILDSPRKISTLLDKMAKIVKEAEAKGEKAPNYDLCNVSVPGTNLFCAESKGIPRIQMPQLRGFPEKGSIADRLMPKDEKGKVTLQGDFVRELARSGVKVDQTTEDAAFLKASQNQLDGFKAARMLKKARAGEEQEPIVISKDNYVVDGHHHWAGLVAYEFEKGHDGKGLKVPVRRVDMGIIELLDRANKYAAKMGMKSEAVTGNALAFEDGEWTEVERLWNQMIWNDDEFEAKHPRGEGGKFGSGGGGGEHDDEHGGGHAHGALETIGHGVHSMEEFEDVVEHDPTAILARHMWGPAVQGASWLLDQMGGHKAATGLMKLYTGIKAVGHRLVSGLAERHGKGVADAILGAARGATLGMIHATGLGAASAIPGKHWVVALPLLGLAEAGRAVGLTGPGTVADKALQKLGTGMQALGKSIGWVQKKLGEGGLKAAYGAGKAVGKIHEGVKKIALATTNADDDQQQMGPAEIQQEAHMLLAELGHEWNKLLRQHQGDLDALPDGPRPMPSSDGQGKPTGNAGWTDEARKMAELAKAAKAKAKEAIEEAKKHHAAWQGTLEKARGQFADLKEKAEGHLSDHDNAMADAQQQCDNLASYGTATDWDKHYNAMDQAIVDYPPGDQTLKERRTAMAGMIDRLGKMEDALHNEEPSKSEDDGRLTQDDIKDNIKTLKGLRFKLEKAHEHLRQYALTRKAMKQIRDSVLNMLGDKVVVGNARVQVGTSRLNRIDFVRLPTEVKGTNCANCRFLGTDDDGHHCDITEEGIKEFLDRIAGPDHGLDWQDYNIHGQPVTQRDCCAAWDAKGTKRKSGVANKYEVVQALAKVGKELAQRPEPMPGYGQIFVNDSDVGGHEAEVWYVGGDGDERGFEKILKAKIKKAFPGCKHITYEAETFPPKDEGWKQVYPKQRDWTTNQGGGGQDSLNLRVKKGNQQGGIETLLGSGKDDEEVLDERHGEAEEGRS